MTEQLINEYKNASAYFDSIGFSRDSLSLTVYLVR